MARMYPDIVKTDQIIGGDKNSKHLLDLFRKGPVKQLRRLNIKYVT